MVEESFAVDVHLTSTKEILLSHASLQNLTRITKFFSLTIPSFTQILMIQKSGLLSFETFKK